MVSRSLWRVAVLLLGLWLLPVLPAHAGLAADPLGDTFGVGPVQIDITGTEVVVTPTTTTITLQFATAIAAPSAFAPNSVIGYIDLDTDRNAATGGTAPWGGPVPGGNNWINFFIDAGLVPGPTVGLGDEFYVDLGSEAFQPGLVDVYSTATGLLVGTGTATYGATSLVVTFNTSLIGGVHNLNYGVLVGTFDEPTDRAPNGSVGLESVPEPSTLALAGAAGIAGLALRWRRRRA